MDIHRPKVKGWKEILVQTVNKGAVVAALTSRKANFLSEIVRCKEGLYIEGLIAERANPPEDNIYLLIYTYKKYK
jgi:hypothetical protein